MSNPTLNFRSFHPHIAKAHAAVNQWLTKENLAPGYKSPEILRRKKNWFGKNTPLGAAAQFYVYFPAHYFKVVHTLDTVIDAVRLLNWLKENPRICLVDIGCGGGSASAAFIETLLRLQENRSLTRSVDVFCVGVDLNRVALALYNQLIEHIRGKVHPFINLEHQIINQGAPGAVLTLTECLTKKREQWQQPYLSHVIAMQVNVVSPLSNRHEDQIEANDELKNLGISPDVLAGTHEEFGMAEAHAYKQLIEQVEIDRMHVITVGTGKCKAHVQEMGHALEQVVGPENHTVERIGEGTHTVYYTNPMHSFYKEHRRKTTHQSCFHVDVTTIANTTTEDKDWNGVIDEENLKLAWARARHYMPGESLVDEVEVRLFEANLDGNIARLKQQLIAYAEDVVNTNDAIHYKIPKNQFHARPRGLSKMEEAILSVAIIQRLGKKADALRRNSYAYRISKGQETEYFYENWFNTHMAFIDEARKEVDQHNECAVIRTDIKSFYMRIMQEQLIELSGELSESQRIRWLIRLLLTRGIDEHDFGRGLVQGNIESGFFANIYLTHVDARFGVGNVWNVKFYRYVDDMVFIVPDPEDVPEILNALREELSQLGLELNDEKTEIYKSAEVCRFLKDTAPDECLAQLSQEFDQVLNAIWIATADYRTKLRSHFEISERWWYHVELYQRCLKAIGVYVNVPLLSRRLYRYLFNERRCKDNLKREEELKLPPLPTDSNPEMIEEWTSGFKDENSQWIEDRDELCEKLTTLFYESWGELKQLNPGNTGTSRKLRRHLRFAVKKLAQLGFAEIPKELVEILSKVPWMIREPVQTIENLACQGFSDEMMVLLAHYEAEKTPGHGEYMRTAILRALRFLPDIDSHQWDKIVKYATGGTQVERLLATETWIALSHQCQHLIQDEHINTIKNALERDEPTKTRLKKNYLLIIGKYDSDSVKDIDVDTDNEVMIRNARYFVLKEAEADLFNDPEPEILRKNYYSGKPSDDADGEGNVSPFDTT